MRFALAIAFGVMAGDAAACLARSLSSEEEAFRLSTTVTDTLNGQRAFYGNPTTIYKHGILGDSIEAEVLLLTPPLTSFQPCWNEGVLAFAGDGHVFEDTEPRLVDIDNDGRNEVIAVRSSISLGAQLVIYEEGFNFYAPPFGDAEGVETVKVEALVLKAATPYIGQRNRWLAPIGAADLDGDGTMEIAYIDRPHLAKTLRIVSIDGDLLAEEIAGAGFTNHRIGERDIAGGVRDCGDGPEMIVASADWSQLVAVTYDSAALNARQIGIDTSRPAFAKAMACQ